MVSSSIGSASLHDEDLSEYDKEMQDKLADFMKDQDQQSYDGTDDDFAEERQEKPRNVPSSLPSNQLDHVVLACCNLKEGVAKFEELTGLRPTIIGALRGVGTKSARVAMVGEACYVEIIGPDDKAPSQGLAPSLMDMAEGDLVPYHYAIRNPPGDVKIPKKVGWERDEVVMVFADPEEYMEGGEISKWDLLFLQGHGLGGVVPIFINWRENRFHPTTTLPTTSGSIESVTASAPDDSYIHTLLSDVSDVSLKTGSPALSICLDTPNGMVEFLDKSPPGIVMPGFGDSSHPSLDKRF